MVNTPYFGGGLLAGVRRSGVISPSASIAAPGDPSVASAYNPQLGFLDQLKAFDPTAYSQIIAQGAGPTNPFANYTLGDYRAPTAQSLGPGGARFNGQLSQHYDANGNPIDAIGDPFDFNKYGSGLWAQGFDPASPATPAALWNQYQKDSTSNSDFQQYASPEIAKHGWDPNTKQGLSDIYNNYYGYLAHRMGKAPDSLLSGPLGTILQLAAVATGNPWLGAGVGGTIGGLNSGSILGGALGAAGGYFGANSVANAGGLGGIADSIGNFAQHPLDAIGSAFSNLTSGPPLTSINNLFPADIAARAGAAGSSGLLSTAGSAISAANGLKNLTGTSSGGGNVGFFDSIGSFLSNNAGSLITGGLGLLGQNIASDNLSSAAQQAQTAAKYQPYGIATPGGLGYFSGNTATGVLSPELQAQLANLNQNTQGNYGALQKFNPQDYANQMYSTVKSYSAPNDTFQGNNFLDKLYSSGQWGSTPGEGQLFNFARGKQAEDNSLRFQAQQAGGQEQNRLFGNYIKSLSSQLTTASDPLQYIQAGSQIGTGAAQANSAAARFPWLAANDSAASSLGFWNYLGQQAGNFGQSLISPSSTVNRAQAYGIQPYSPYFQGTSGPQQSYQNA